MSEPLLAQLAMTLARQLDESERQRKRLHLLEWSAGGFVIKAPRAADTALRSDDAGALDKILGDWLG